MRWHVIGAVVRRELAGYFSNPTGYVFITLFVFLSGVAAFWVPAFFDRNLANLDQLTSWYGVLLLFLAPAISMGAWSVERQQGTDELLISLPATVWELVLGKYLGCVAIYGVCLLFAGAHVLVLAYLGRPDAGVIAANFVGYFLAGCALLGVGLAASTLTTSSTIAFVTAAALCGVLVGLGALERLLPGTPLARVLGSLSVPQRLEGFGRGVIDLADVLYFVGVGAIGVWLAAQIVARRRLIGMPQGIALAGHLAVRGAALAVALHAGLVLVGRAGARVDATAERLWSISPETRALVRSIPREQPVTIAAYLSARVPSSMEQTRTTLEGLLRELASISGGRVRVQITPTEPFTEAAREAEKSYGIRARPVTGDDPAGRPEDVFMGFAVTGGGGADQSVVSFVARGVPVEYELARSIRTVTAGARKTVGVLDTEAALYGRFDFQTMTPGRNWPIVAELEKQYTVSRVPATGPVPPEIDVLIVPQPSTLPADQLEHVLAYLRAGRPALVLEDPLPLVNPALATSEPRAPRNPMQPFPPPEPKADITPLWDLLGARVVPDQVVWDTRNPHPELGETPPEFIWVYRAGRPAGSAFNDALPISAGLQEMVLLFPGPVEAVAPAAPADGASPPGAPAVEPLLRSSESSGRMAYGSILQRSMFGVSGLNPARRPTRLNQAQTLAAWVTGGPSNIRAVLLGDLDMVSETFFSIRESGVSGLEFDNVTFVLNAVDVLAGDASLVELRGRRREYRTLERVEAARAAGQELALAAEAAAIAKAESELAEARGRFEAKVKEIEGRADVDEMTRRIMAESVRRSEQRRLDAQSAAIEDERRRAIEDARLRSRREIERLQMNIRVRAVLLPPIPALAIGTIVFLRRRAGESADAGGRA